MNYIKYLNECFFKRIDYSFKNESISNILPSILDFDYIKWAIRNVGWFTLSPSFFDKKFTVNQIVDIKKSSNLLFEFKLISIDVNVKDYLNDDDFKLNLSKLNIKFDTDYEIHTITNPKKESFENYLIDDDISYYLVYENYKKWGLIGKIIDELETYIPDYEEDYMESANDDNWLRNAAGTDDPETMNDVYWNID